MTLWSKDPSTSDMTQKYLEEDKELEEKILPYDVLGNIAHVKMLEKQGYLETKEFEEIIEVLIEIYKEKPKVDAEDVHTFVEEYVTKKTEAGKKMHTGRSRNDQIVLDTRLYMKDSCIRIAQESLGFIKALEKFGEEKNTLIPGYTHQQQAMPSSIALWSSSFIDSLIDDLKMLKSIYKILDQNPLGAAAGYGTSLNIDRAYTTELLDFSSVQKNPLYCVNRGKHEFMFIQSLNQIMLDCGKIAEDLINFSEDQKIFNIPEKFCTGSSIMPQKQNPDVLEIARAKTEEINAANQAIFGIISKLPSGFNRDTQETKKYLFMTVQNILETLEILTNLFIDLEISDEFEIKDEIYAAYSANQLVESGTPFREAHHKIKESKEYLENDNIDELTNQCYKDLEKFWKEKEENFEKMKENLINLRNSN